MPSVSGFKRSHDALKQESVKAAKSRMSKVLAKVEKRRPGRDEFATEFDKKSKIAVHVVEVDQMTENQNHNHKKNKAKATTAHAEEESTTNTEESSSANRIDINFPGSEVLRAKFPKSFEAAESVATDWVNDGKFDQIPVGNPLAKAAVQQGLLKAKEIEKKVMASPLTEKVAVQAFTYAAKAQGFVNNLRSRVNSKKNDN
jgi:hypothetical protein